MPIWHLKSYCRVKTPGSADGDPVNCLQEWSDRLEAEEGFWLANQVINRFEIVMSELQSLADWRVSDRFSDLGDKGDGCLGLSQVRIQEEKRLYRAIGEYNLRQRFFGFLLIDFKGVTSGRNEDFYKIRCPIAHDRLAQIGRKEAYWDGNLI